MNGRAAYRAQGCWTKGGSMPWAERSRTAGDFTVLLGMVCTLNLRIVYFWDFPFTISRPWLAKGNWNHRKRDCRKGGPLHLFLGVFWLCGRGWCGRSSTRVGLESGGCGVACSWLSLFNVFPTLPIPHLTAKCGSQWAVNMAKRLKALGLEKDWIKILALLFSVIWLAQSLDFSKLRLPHL